MYITLYISKFALVVDTLCSIWCVQVGPHPTTRLVCLNWFTEMTEIIEFVEYECRCTNNCTCNRWGTYAATAETCYLHNLGHTWIELNSVSIHSMRIWMESLPLLQTLEIALILWHSQKKSRQRGVPRLSTSKQQKGLRQSWSPKPVNQWEQT